MGGYGRGRKLNPHGIEPGGELYFYHNLKHIELDKGKRMKEK